MKRKETLVVTSGQATTARHLAVSAPTYYAFRQGATMTAASLTRAGVDTGPANARTTHAIEIDLHG